MILKIVLCFLLLPLSSFAQTLPMNKEQYCERFDQNKNTDLLLDLSQNQDNLLSFKNNGGLFNGGVCWWHSRFQRNLLYLTQLKPHLPKLQKHEIPQLIREIRLGMGILVIPGFNSIENFSKHYQAEIQRELNDWQLYDGIVLNAWINGIKGNHKIEAHKLKKMMDELYQYVGVEKKIAYQKLQIKGITAHAWLVVGIKKNSDGYDLGVVDSNAPQVTKSFNYRVGNTSFYTKSYGDFVPYLEFKREELRLSSLAKSYCGLKAHTFSDTEIHHNEDLDIEEHNQVYN